MRIVTDAVVANLAAAGLTVGDGQAPDAGFPHVIVYPIPDDGRDGPSNDRHADVRHQYQLTCVGQYRDQAEWVSDEARTALTTTPITVAGFTVMGVDEGLAGGTSREDDESPPVFNVADTYVIWMTPN